MQKKSNFEKTLLAIMAVLALVVAGFLIYLSQGFADTLVLAPVKPKQEMGEVPLQKVEDATQLLLKSFNWVSPTINKKPVPLNKSIPLIKKGDVLYDLYVEEPKLRDPITNLFLIEHTLENILSPNLGDLDQDEDGFTNAEEFAGNTSPRDPLKHPPFTNHLFLKQRVADDYIIKLNSSIDPYQVVLTAPRRDSAYIQPPLPKPFGFRDPVTRQVNERFVAESFVKKEEPNTARDLSELTVTDKSSNATFILIKGVDKNLAEYYAEFEYRHKEVFPTIKVKKGELLRLPGVGATYKVIDIEETKAVISELDASGKEGPKLEINRR